LRFELGRWSDVVEQRLAVLVAEDAATRIWARDPSFWGGDSARRASVANRLGWLDIAEQMRANVAVLETFAAEVRDAGFTHAVVLGMGGSSLAPEVLRQSVPARDGHPTLLVLDTTDPVSIAAVRDAVDIERTLFFVSSKSGTTVEPLSLFAYFWSLVDTARPGRTGEQFVAITDAGTPLEALGREHSFRRIFTNPADIGGRYSALSYFGLAPAAATGIDVKRLLDAGLTAANDARRPNSSALRLGAALAELAVEGHDKCTFIVSSALDSFGLWAEQLIAESTGKDGRGVVPVVGEPLGSPMRYGDDRVFVQLRLDGGGEAEDDATAGALVAEGQPLIVLDLEDPHDLGGQFFLWEFAIAVAGQVLGINPFDEPNVQESKDNTNRVLAEFERTGMLEQDAVDAQVRAVGVSSRGIDPLPLAQTVGGLLEQIRPRDYVAITAFIPQDERIGQLFDEIRATIRDEFFVATTLGYGPRYLHSTGQLHKGGPPEGVFLQLTSNDALDIEIPGRSFTFAELKRAQAIGDYQSFEQRDRPLLRVHLGDDIINGLVELREAIRTAASAVPHGVPRRR
jgi:glucose-6-phosphate isomerase